MPSWHQTTEFTSWSRNCCAEVVWFWQVGSWLWDFNLSLSMICISWSKAVVLRKITRSPKVPDHEILGAWHNHWNKIMFFSCQKAKVSCLWHTGSSRAQLCSEGKCNGFYIQLLAKQQKWVIIFSFWPPLVVIVFFIVIFQTLNFQLSSLQLRVVISIDSNDSPVWVKVIMWYLFCCSAKVLVKGEPNVSYICSRYYRAPELIFGATDYTPDIG